MYIKHLLIKRFRSIKELNLSFNKELNVIIGPNNAGKTGIVDALRICLGLGSQIREIGIRNDEDFYLDTSNPDYQLEPIEFQLIFEIECEEDREYFTSLLWQNPDIPEEIDLRLNLKYWLETNGSGKRLKWSHWGGESSKLDSNELQLLYYTYLAPLRNAEYELRPYSKDNKVSSLFREMSKYSKTQIVEGLSSIVDQVLDDDHKVALATKLENVVNDNEWSGLIKSGETLVNKHLEKSDIANKNPKVKIGLINFKYNNIVKGVVTSKQIYSDSVVASDISKQRYFDISQNGLGENNIIFSATVFGDIENRRIEKKEHYYAMLIEEPEAHLHPQRQNTFFTYLNELKDFGVQVFMTCHSPTITAKTSIQNLHVLQNINHCVEVVSVKNIVLEPKETSYLRKFLDVTKSQLFFSNGTILVEGISEALLLPVLSRRMIPNGKFSIEKNGIELVNIDGVAFEPFAKLYNSDDNTKRLATKCLIVTDDDRGIISAIDFQSNEENIDKDTSKAIIKHLQSIDFLDDTNRMAYGADISALVIPNLTEKMPFIRSKIEAKNSAPSARASKASGFEKNNLKTVTAQITFEYELMISGNNIDLISNLYATMHTGTTFLDTTHSKEERAREILIFLNNFKDKSELAQQIAYNIDNESTWNEFVAPQYIVDGINWLIDG